MKKLTLLALAAAAAMVVAPALAQEKAGEKTAEAKAEKISGTIEKVDATAKTIDVKAGERLVNLKLEEKTEIHRGKDRIKIADLKVGDRVEVEAHGQVARHIKVETAEKKMEQPAKATNPGGK
jgi:Cu/Ag efflux protein CusF